MLDFWGEPFGIATSIARQKAYFLSSILSLSFFHFRFFQFNPVQSGRQLPGNNCLQPASQLKQFAILVPLRVHWFSFCLLFTSLYCTLVFLAVEDCPTLMRFSFSNTRTYQFPIMWPHIVSTVDFGTTFSGFTPIQLTVHYYLMSRSITKLSRVSQSVSQSLVWLQFQFRNSLNQIESKSRSRCIKK